MNQIPSIGYNVIVQTFTTQTEVEVTPSCNGVSIRNIGDTVCMINGIRLLPTLVAGGSGESTQFGGNLGELYKGRLQLQFIGAGVAPLVEIIQKYYLYESR
jgi:hypothetical protein